jgi:hypothetical protein
MDRHAESVGVIAPTRAQARAAAAFLRRRMPGARFRLLVPSDLSFGRRITDALVICPAGADLAEDIGFLSRVNTRALWPAPDADIHGAISGLLGHHLPALSGPVARGRSSRKIALLIEGEVTAERARAALRSDTRHWIVESASRVRLSERQLRRYRELGVRWAALKSVRVLGVLASAPLARARRRWRKLVPEETPVWIFER